MRGPPASTRSSWPPATITTTWESEGATPPPAGHTGLYHVAFVYPDRRQLVKAVLRLREFGHVIEQYSDHGGSVAVYLDDPDGNGVELYYDRRAMRGAMRTAGRCCAPTTSARAPCRDGRDRHGAAAARA